MSIKEQIYNEEYYSKHHTVGMVKAYMPELAPFVREYIQKVDAFYTVEPSEFFYEVNGETRHWKTKQERYDYVVAMDLTDLCWDIVVSCITQKEGTFAQIIGKVYKKLDLGARQAIETIGEMLGILSDTPFITLIAPKYADSETLSFKSCVNLSDEVEDYLRTQTFILPSLVPPKIVYKNHHSGYQTLNDGLILGGKLHDKPINYGHINRMNQVPLNINKDVVLRTEPIFKEKDGESLEDRAERLKQWTQMNKEAVVLYAEFADKDFYLTNRKDERGRTYTRGHHFNPQGDNYRKAVVEFANQEVTQA